MGIGNWFSRWLAPKPASAPVPDGWTDDMTINVQPPHTLAELVDFVLSAESRKVPSPETGSKLITEFGLSEDEASLAWGRALGGLVRAATGNPANCPDKEKDPVAWISYQRCLLEPELIAAIRPQYVTDQQGWVRKRGAEKGTSLIFTARSMLIGMTGCLRNQ